MSIPPPSQNQQLSNEEHLPSSPLVPQQAADVNVPSDASAKSAQSDSSERPSQPRPHHVRPGKKVSDIRSELHALQLRMEKLQRQEQQYQQQWIRYTRLHTSPEPNLHSSALPLPPAAPMPSSTPSMALSSSSAQDVASRKRKSLTPEPSATSNPDTKRKRKITGKKLHATLEQETFIAKEVANPDMWDFLFGPNPINAYNKLVREAITIRFNIKFNTGTTASEIDETQLKNKLHNMMKRWMNTHRHFKQTDNGDLPSPALKNRILRACHYYYTWEPFASRSLNLNPGDSIQLTGNLSRKITIGSNDADESNDEDDLSVRQGTDDNTPPKASRVQSLESGQQAKEPTRSRKKSTKTEATEMLKLIKYLKDKADEDRELWKQNQLSTQNYQIQALELERQKLRFQMKKEKRMANIQDNIKLAELEKVRAETAKARAEAEYARAKITALQTTGTLTPSQEL